MDKKDITFFGEAVALVASILGFVMMLIVLLLFGEVGILAFLTDYGSIVGALIAIGVAYFTIKKQTKNVRAQIDNQQRIANSNRFLDKKQELILAMGECRKTIIILADECEKNSYALADDKQYKYNNLIAEKLNLCVFLMLEYSFTTKSEQNTYSNLVNLILNLTSSNYGLKNNHITFLKQLDTKDNDELFLELYDQLNAYKSSDNADLLETNYLGFFPPSVRINDIIDNFLKSKSKQDSREYKRQGNDYLVRVEQQMHDRESYYHLKKEDVLDELYWRFYKVVGLKQMMDAFTTFDKDLLDKIYDSKLL